jgi:hypothetical protein
MKTILFSLIAIILFLFVNPGCSPEKKQDEIDFQRIEFSNASAIFNLSRTHVYFGSYTNDLGETAIMAADGDLLFLMFEDESLFIRYEKEYGNFINIVMDTVVNQRFYDQENLIGLEFTEDSILMDWLDSVDGNQFNSLQTLQITLPLTNSSRSRLQKIMNHTYGIGLVLEGDGDINHADLEILYKFSPDWIYLIDCQLDIQDELYAAMFENLELLGIEGGNIDWSIRPDIFVNLKSLILKDWDPLETGYYSLPNSKDLRSVTLVESNFTNLSFLEQFPGLKSFHAVLCDTLSNIDYLNEITSLVSVGFPYCEKIVDLGPIDKHPSLIWISFPSNLKPEGLSQVNAHFPKLQVIELIGCDAIEDCEFLEEMFFLKALIVDQPDLDLTPLLAISNLELLVIEESEFKESSEEIARIQEANPGIKALPGGGICLGSGWILLIYPLVLIVWISRYKRKYKK